jgi:hypothetical protein
MEREIRSYFNEYYDGVGDNIEYINAAYDIGSYYELSEKLRAIKKDKMMVENYMKENKLSAQKFAEMAENSGGNKDFPHKVTGICGRITPLDYKEIVEAYNETKREMEIYEVQATENADSDKIKEKFSGIVFVIFKSPQDCIKIRKK